MMRSLLDRKCNAEYAGGLLRALLGAMVFALPLLMTMRCGNWAPRWIACASHCSCS
jgi:hypothetical protein